MQGRPLTDLIQRIRSCASCAERRVAMREAIYRLRESLGLRSNMEARRVLNQQMGEGVQRNENP